MHGMRGQASASPGEEAGQVEEAEESVQRRCILILGMHRSGTSALTRMLNLAGAQLPLRMLGAAPGNDVGHWEPKALILYHDHFLSEIGSAWSDWAKADLTRLAPGRAAEVTREMQRIYEYDFANAPLFVVKEPRMCRFSGFAIDALEGLGVHVAPVLTLRNPVEVIDSLEKRDGMPREEAALLWLRHVLDAEAETRGRPRAFTSFEAVLGNWREELARIAAALQLKLPYKADEIGPLVDEFLSPNLRHHIRASSDVSLDPALRGWVSDAYTALRILQNSPNSKEAFAALDDIRGSFERASPMLVALKSAASANLESLKRGIDEASQQAHVRNEEAERLSQRLAERERDLQEANQRLVSAADAQAHTQAALDATISQLAHQDTLLKAKLDAAAADLAKQQELAVRDADRTLWFERELAQRSQELEQARATIKAVEQSYLSSTSWRITAPVRGAKLAPRVARRLLPLGKFASARAGGFGTLAVRALQIAAREGFAGIEKRAAFLEGLRTSDQPGGSLSRLETPALSSCRIITTPHCMYVAQLMRDRLDTEGFHVSIVTSIDGNERFDHNFVICPQMFERLPDQYYAVQMEQCVSDKWWTSEYILKLERAKAILDYSLRNIEHLTRSGFRTPKLFFVPLSLNAKDYANAMRERRTSDWTAPRVLFYGDDKCERRQLFLEELKRRVPSLKIVNNLFGDELGRVLRDSDIVVNIHYYEGALLETTRIYEALSNGALVVSETSSDLDEHVELNGAVEFTSLGDAKAMADRVEQLIADASMRDDRRKAIDAIAERESRRHDYYFGRFLFNHKLVGYDALTLRSSQRQSVAPPHPKLCLSLPETPIRRQKFVEQRLKDFVLWDGVRSELGWQGAALSYKTIFSDLRAANVKTATICEDDVVAGPDFPEKYALVQRYLATLPDWDLFSGFIADVHGEAKVVKVVDFAGVRFVHLDRAVSMVFNIYNEKLIEYLSQWDPDNHDVMKNTIDRYLEARVGTKVVTTVPFLVGHRDDVHSTIWGFKNDEYNSLVDRSEQLLESKVRDFLFK